MSNLKGLTLPIYEPDVFDNSMLSTFQRCPRKGFYQYGLRRAPVGVNFPIQFGQAYHRFRDYLEKLHIKVVKEKGEDLEDPKTQRFIYEVSFKKALEVTRTRQLDPGKPEFSFGWVEPPIGHKKEYLTIARLDSTCSLAFESWLSEKREEVLNVILSEQSFGLTLPNGEKYGGRFDQLMVWNGKLWLRDFKTTSRMGKSYGQSFDPDNQMSGYIWGATELSNEAIEGVSIDVVYNTKTLGPDFFPFLSTRTPWQIENWLEETQVEIKNVRRCFEDRVFPKRTKACDDYGGCFFRDACRRDGWGNIERWLLNNTIESYWDFMNPDKEEGVVD